MASEVDALRKHLFVDNHVKNIKFFAGSNADSLSEDIALQINRFFADPDEATTPEDASDGE